MRLTAIAFQLVQTTKLLPCVAVAQVGLDADSENDGAVWPKIALSAFFVDLGTHTFAYVFTFATGLYLGFAVVKWDMADADWITFFAHTSLALTRKYCATLSPCFFAFAS